MKTSGLCKRSSYKYINIGKCMEMKKQNKTNKTNRQKNPNNKQTKNKQAQGLQSLILFVEIFANIKSLHIKSFSEDLAFFLLYLSISLMSRVFANGPGDQGSIPSRAIPKTKKNGTKCLLA